MKIVAKIGIEQIPILQKKGYTIKFLPIGVAKEIFGDVVYKDAGEHLYVSIDLLTSIDELLGEKIKLVHA